MGLFGTKPQAPLTPEEAERKLAHLQKQLDATESKLTSKKAELDGVTAQIKTLSGQLKALHGQVDFELEMQDFGLYAPTYKFTNSDKYKDRLVEVRHKQKQLIKDGKACSGNMGWTVNGSKAQGNKMVKDMQKLLLRAFNVECDEIIGSVTISNIERSRDRIWKSAEQISKLGDIMSISILPGYIKLKIDELNLALDFAQKKQEEKDRLRELREQQREEAKAQKEIAEKLAKLEKERTHYTNALETLLSKLAADPGNPDLLAKKHELEAEISETDKAIADVDYRQANIRAGYVYIISNIGAFGKDVYKIGMTRRLEPLERVDELGGASVPFQFDVHALIFTEDAPGLEAALHSAFEKQKVNKINTRREFFRVSLDEIKRVVRKNFDKTVEWVDIPAAEQFRQTLLMDGVSEPRTIDRTLQPLPGLPTSLPVPTHTPAQAPVPENKTAQQEPVKSPVQTKPTVESTSPAEPIKKKLPSTPAEAIVFLAEQGIPGCRIQEEDTPEMLKIHIYYPDNRKFGIVKIFKADGAMQLRKLAGGAPQNYFLPFANELKKYF